MNYEIIAAYLAGECNEAEKQEIESWRKASPENEQDFQRWQLLWQASHNHYHNYEPDLAKAWQKINPAKQATFKVSKRKTIPAQQKFISWIKYVAAMLAVAIGVGWGIRMAADYFITPAISWIEQTAPADEKKQFALPDGTLIWLNAGSKLRYQKEFISIDRDVYLEGEAFFEVEKDPKRPFRIYTTQSVTEVLGTSFSVRAYSGEPTVEVVVVTGKVAFSNINGDTEEKVSLLPNQKAILDKKTHTITVSANLDHNFLAWKTGKFIFQDTPLREVLPGLEKYYHTAFTVSDSLLLNCRFTGSFNQTPIEDVLQVFAFGSDITYRKEANGYVLAGNGCK